MAKQEIAKDHSGGGGVSGRFKGRPLLYAGVLILLVLTIAAFVLVPAIVPEAAGGNTDLTFGYYNKKPITYVPGNYFAQAYENVVSQYQKQGYDMSNPMMASNIWRQAFDAALVHVAILDEMTALGYKAPVKEVDRAVAMLPQFQDENGRFSAARYRNTDPSTRLNQWREVQESIAVDHYRSDLTGLRISSKEADFIGAMAGPVRTFDMAAISINGYPDTEVAAYGTSNAKKFRLTHLSRITINSSEKEAREVLKTIQDGTSTFEDAARTHSQDSYADKGGDMGYKMVYELEVEIPEEADREAAVGLAKDAYSNIIKVGSGWAFFRAVDAVKEPDFADSATLEKVRSYMLSFERGKIEDWASAQGRAFAAEARASTFDDAAKARSLEKKTFGPVGVNYGSTDLFATVSSFNIPELSGADSNDRFWKICFSTPVGTPTEPLIIGSNAVVFCPTEEKPAETNMVDYIKSAYGSWWMTYTSSQSIADFFIRSPKTKDEFFTTFIKYFWPENS